MSKWDIFASSDIKRYLLAWSLHSLTHWKEREDPSRMCSNLLYYWLHLFLQIYKLMVQLLCVCAVCWMQIHNCLGIIFFFLLYLDV